MSEVPRIRVCEIALFEWPYVFRMPFRFGAVTLTHGRQAVARVRVALDDGRSAWGMAAEGLIAKWFDKDPSLTDDDNVEQLRRSLELARAAYLAHGPGSAFSHFADSYAALMRAGASQALPPLVVSFGAALIDRAIVDALGRLESQSFFDLVRSNRLGIAPAVLAPDLDGFDAARLLSGLVPLGHVDARHTVGLLDPLVGADQTSRVGDGLPETLEEVVAAYGQRFFKLKLCGDVPSDIDRLSRIADVLDRQGEYGATLDGNEQYGDADAVLALLEAMARTPRLRRLLRSLLFVEQPIRRAVALDRDVSALDAFAPILIDESDGHVDTFPAARALGYRGISSKTCKGFYKSLINRMRCAAWNAEAGSQQYFMSAEDLTQLAGLCVQQDLALVALIGLRHVERNGHHFVDGFAGRPAAEAQAFLAAHPDLYHVSAGQVRLRIEGGRLSTASLAAPGFATGAHPDTNAMATMKPSRWHKP